MRIFLETERALISDLRTQHENTGIRTADRKELSTNGVAMTTISVCQNFRFPFFLSKNLQNEKEYKLADWLASKFFLILLKQLKTCHDLKIYKI